MGSFSRFLDRGNGGMGLEMLDILIIHMTQMLVYFFLFPSFLPLLVNKMESTYFKKDSMGKCLL